MVISVSAGVLEKITLIFLFKSAGVQERRKIVFLFKVQETFLI